jgi:hypothetical protein
MMTLRHLVLVAGLALVAQPVIAADRHRGGGGGHSNPGAVTRGGGGGGHSYPGAVTRGGGGGRHYYRPSYGGRNSYYGGYRGGHYGRYPYSSGYRGGYYGRYPYYGGYRGGYYGRYPYYGGYYGSGPYYGAYWGGSYQSYSYPPGVVYDYDNAAPAETAVVDSNGNRPPDADSRLVRLRLEVRPDDTSVYVDDQFKGAARETRMLYLPPGSHKIELVRPGFTTEVREVLVALGETHDLSVELQRP